MTTPFNPTGPIPFDQIYTFFGGPGGTNIALGNYYRGGGYVPDFAENSGVPTSGALSVSSLRNAYKTLPSGPTYDSLPFSFTVASSGSFTGKLSSTGPWTSTLGSVSMGTILFDTGFNELICSVTASSGGPTNEFNFSSMTVGPVNVIAGVHVISNDGTTAQFAVSTSTPWSVGQTISGEIFWRIA